MDERPPVSPAKLLSQFRDWVDETELPGRTMSYLKTGSMPEVLVELAANDGVPEMIEVWEGWEKGRTHPTVVLEALRDGGIEELLTNLAPEPSSA